MEADFRRGNLRVLIATNTLAQGVNMPVKTVIIHSCRRYENNTMQRISARDYWNIAGRAGRAGFETAGLVLHIVNNSVDLGDYRYYVSRRDSVEAVESALYRRLRDLVEERITREQFAAEFDSEVLALLVEESEASLDNGEKKPLIDGTFAEVRCAKHAYDFTKIADAFAGAAALVAAENPEEAFRSLYSSTGLASASCKLLQTRIEEASETLPSILAGASTDQIDLLIDAVVPTCLELPEMTPGNAFGGNNIDLLKTWIRGASMRPLLQAFAVQSQKPESLVRFIEDLFGYKLPWGISAFLGIARVVLAERLEDFSLTTKFFGSMVKFGLPDPVACWAMSSGVPLRSSAMAMASAFRRLHTDLTHEAFAQWLFYQSSEELLNEYGIKGPFLSRLARTLATSGANPVLASFSTIESLLPMEFEVKGIAYENRRFVASGIETGTVLQIKRDYDNLSDRNAILVIAGGLELGYVPRSLSQVVAPEIDLGLELSAIVSRVEPGTIVHVFAQLKM